MEPTKLELLNMAHLGVVLDFGFQLTRIMARASGSEIGHRSEPQAGHCTVQARRAQMY